MEVTRGDLDNFKRGALDLIRAHHKLPEFSTLKALKEAIVARAAKNGVVTLDPWQVGRLGWQLDSDRLPMGWLPYARPEANVGTARLEPVPVEGEEPEAETEAEEAEAGDAEGAAGAENDDAAAAA
jgi:hypothetical protein